MKLQQGQVWKQGDLYIRIVHLERREVQYKALPDITTSDGTHHHVTKKDFCRLVKNATLLTAADIQEVYDRLQVPVPPVD